LRKQVHRTYFGNSPSVRHQRTYFGKSPSVHHQKTWGWGSSSAASRVCNVTIALACDAVEAKAKYPMPGIHPTSTSKQKRYIFCRIPIALSDSRDWKGGAPFLTMSKKCVVSGKLCCELVRAKNVLSLVGVSHQHDSSTTLRNLLRVHVIAEPWSQPGEQNRRQIEVKKHFLCCTWVFFVTPSTQSVSCFSLKPLRSTLSWPPCSFQPSLTSPLDWVEATLNSRYSRGVANGGTSLPSF
jgi:hypothetical protein